MSFYTAQVRTSDNIVVAVTETSKPLSDPPAGITFVPIESYRADFILKKYENGEFVNP